MSDHGATVAEYTLFRQDPFWRLLGALGLASGGRPRLWLAMPAIALVTWGGLAAAVALQAVVWPGATLRADFFRDFSAASQFIVALPLFLAAEVHLDWRARAAFGYIQRSLVRDDATARSFVSIQAETRRLATGPVEWLPLLLGYVVTVAWILDERRLSAAGWYLANAEGGGVVISLPGWYAVLIVIPFLNAYWARWAWKTALWCRALWRVSRLKLRLYPDHPDGMAGLGIVSWVQMAFALVAFAVGVVMSATVGYKLSVQGLGTNALGIWLPVVAFVLLAPILFLLPLLFFTRSLLEAKQRGLVELGALGVHYAEQFEHHSTQEVATRADFMDLGVQLSGLSGFEAAYDHVNHMKIVPFDLRSLGQFIFSAVAPVLPLIIKYLHLPKALFDFLNGVIQSGAGH